MSEIDVTKCENYKLGFSGYICADPNLRNDCSLNNNCKFKQLQRYKQAIEKIKEIAEQNIDDKQIMAVQTMLNGSPDVKNEVLKQIIQKCEEVRYKNENRKRN